MGWEKANVRRAIWAGEWARAPQRTIVRAKVTAPASGRWFVMRNRFSTLSGEMSATNISSSTSLNASKYCSCSRIALSSLRSAALFPVAGRSLFPVAERALVAVAGRALVAVAGRALVLPAAGRRFLLALTPPSFSSVCAGGSDERTLAREDAGDAGPREVA